MIRLTENKIAVQLIRDNDEVETKAALSKKELEFLGITEDQLQQTTLEVPDDAKERSDQGIVKYVGPAVKDVKIGDHVLFGGYTGTTVLMEDEGAMVILREDFVIAILDSPDTVVPGLYLYDGSDYFPTTYEIAIQLMAEAMGNSAFGRSVHIKNQKDSRE